MANKLPILYLATILTITFVSIAVNATINPAMPTIKKHLHLNSVQSALLIAIVPLVGLITSPLIGWIVDKYNYRNTIVVPLVLLITSIAGGIGGVSINYYMLLTCRAVQGLAAYIVSGCISLIVHTFADSVSMRVRWIGYNAAILTIGLAIHPAIGGLLAHVHWRLAFLPFWFSVPLSILSYYILNRTSRDNNNCDDRVMVVTSSTSSEPTATSSESTTTIGDGNMGNSRNSSTSSTLIPILLTTDATITYGSVIITFLLIYMVPLFSFPFILAQRLHIDSDIISIYLCIGATTTAGVTFFHFWFHKHIHHHLLMILGILTMSTSFLLISFTTSPWLLSFSAAIYGIGEALVIPTTQSSITLLPNYNQQHKTTLMTLWATTSRIGQLIGPLLAVSISSGHLIIATVAGSSIGIVWICIILLITLYKRCFT